MADNKQINIKVENLIPTLVDGCQKIFCDNGDYKVHFSFDEEWENYNVKTALFVCGDNTFPSVFEGDECEVPEIDGGTTCYIGVVSGDIVADNVSPKKKTSRWVCVEAVPTITSISKEPKAPTNDVYVEFMALLNKYIEQGGSESGGVSPTINITEIDNGYRVTIVDINGEKSFDVTNGKDGVNGVDGKDGYTPKKYVDYWNEADQKEIKDYVDTLVNPLIEEINGIEETLHTINEGGIEI